MYADKVTRSMQAALAEMDRRRTIQREYNEKHGITPTSIKKSVGEAMVQHEKFEIASLMVAEEEEEYITSKNPQKLIVRLEKQMYAAAKNLEFEKAAELRDRVKRLRDKELMISA